MKWIPATETELIDQKTYYLKFDKFEDAYSGRYFKDYNQFFSSAIAGNWMSIEGVSVLDESPSPVSKEEIHDAAMRVLNDYPHFDFEEAFTDNEIEHIIAAMEQYANQGYLFCHRSDQII